MKTSKLTAGLMVLVLTAGAPQLAEASPWNIDPVTGAITTSGSLSFTFVSRSAGFTHVFGGYTLGGGLLQTLFTIPPTTGGATTTWTPGAGTYLFGLYVDDTGITWLSDGTQNPVDATQVLKFRFTNINAYTTRMEIEDLKNLAGGSASTCTTAPVGNFVEPCDYNDAVIDVTNTPEPATMGLMALGLVGMAAAGFRRRRS
jgi:hypothetical protein